MFSQFIWNSRPFNLHRRPLNLPFSSQPYQVVVSLSNRINRRTRSSSTTPLSLILAHVFIAEVAFALGGKALIDRLIPNRIYHYRLLIIHLPSPLSPCLSVPRGNAGPNLQIFHTFQPRVFYTPTYKTILFWITVAQHG